MGRTGPEGGQTSLFPRWRQLELHQGACGRSASSTNPAGLIDFSNFYAPTTLRKLKSVHGAESALYGSDAVAGVIQIFTRRGTTRTPDSPLSAKEAFRKGRGGAELSASWAVSTIRLPHLIIETSGQGPNDAFRNRTVSGNFRLAFYRYRRAQPRVTRQRQLPRALRAQRARFGKYTKQPLAFTISAGSPMRSHHQYPLASSVERHRVLLSRTEISTRFSQPFINTTAQFRGAVTYLIHGLALLARLRIRSRNGFISYVVCTCAGNNQAGFLDARCSRLCG